MNDISRPLLTLSGSQRKIFSVYLMLLKEKEIEKITVSELCIKAEVNRSTFYRNYYDIYDLEEKVELYFIDSLIAFWSANNFCLDQSVGKFCSLDDVKDLEVDDSDMFLDILKTMRFDKRLAMGMFNRLFKVIYDYLDNDIKFNDDVANALSFMLNGSILYYMTNSSNFDSDTISEFVKITSYFFSEYIKQIRNKSTVEISLIKTKKSDISPKNKDRLSVMKTKRSLRNSFFEMCGRQSTNEVAVSELCKKAEISHSTFYNHYASISDFIDGLKNEIVNVSVEISHRICDSLDIGTNCIDITELTAFISKMQRYLSKLSSFDSYLLELPKSFSENFFKYIDQSFDCRFDKYMSFELICYCGYSSLLMPCGKDALSLDAVFNIAYSALMILFTKKSV